eukprot:CAMPEP_0179468544 /NCGR_PEP_ID=MMETSP0799-20121207/49446_1 /TAXON_ID=46947 /ORGANISM="Geminigera cryophila, Strain CCMP2564" /LENGTH=102 /DNA_ID=CAMNT_0021274605 /DNA_START=87 /DNA_END=395 /DNA_ORIENTATION=+
MPSQENSKPLRRTTVIVLGCCATLKLPAPDMPHMPEVMGLGAGCSNILTLDPASPLSIASTSCPPDVGISSTSTILSPTRMPAARAAPSTSTRVTSQCPFRN